MFVTKITGNLEERTFCTICQKYSSKSLSKSKYGDWTIKGKNFEGKPLFRKNEALKVHLNSEEHLNSLLNRENEKRKFEKSGVPSKETREKATIGYLMAVMFMIAQNLSFRNLNQLSLLFHKVYENMYPDLANPIGNQHHSHVAFKKGAIAIYEALIEILKLFYSDTNIMTKQKKRFTVAADLGTAPGDFPRQAITVTFIGKDGFPKESLAAVTPIFDPTAVGTRDHLKVNLNKILDCQNICGLSTDGAAYYTGIHNGMIVQIKRDPCFSKKVLFFPDLCHRMELWVDKNEPKWVKEAIEESSAIIKLIKGDRYLFNTLNRINYDKLGYTFYAFKQAVETRFAQYFHGEIMSILKNIRAMIFVLENLIVSPGTNESKSNTYLNLLSRVTNFDFLSRLLAMRSFYQKITTYEKMAQDAVFGPFEYVSIIENLKRLLNTDLTSLDANINVLLEEGIYKISYLAWGKRVNVALNLKKVRDRVLDNILNLRSKVTVPDIKNCVGNWMKNLYETIDKYLEVSHSMSLAVKLFKLKDGNVSEKTNQLREFLSIVNTNFLPCGESCLGLEECQCIEQEMTSFLRFAKNDKFQEKCSNMSTKCKIPSQTCILSYFLDEKNKKRNFKTQDCKCH